MINEYMFPLNVSISKNKFKTQVKANFFRILSLDQHTKNIFVKELEKENVTLQPTENETTK